MKPHYKFLGVALVLAFPFLVSAATFTSPLNVGSSGSEVSALQQFLSNKGYLSASPTGYYGPLTQAAVRQFQSANGIAPLGNVGPATRAALNAASADAEVLGAETSASGIIPLTFNSSVFSGATNSGSVTLSSGGTLTNKSITVDGPQASVQCNGACTLDRVRVNSAEAVRVGGSGTVSISNSYLEAVGSGDDHADVIQAYAPGDRGTINISNTSIVAHNTAATAGLFVADNWTGNVNLNNVVFNGGPFGLRLHPDVGGDIIVTAKDVYFVGPFGYDPILMSDVAGKKNIVNQWENVRWATIVNGELIPGALIPCPVSSCGTASSPIEPTPTPTPTPTPEPEPTPVADTSRPSKPTGLTAAAISSSAVNLSWKASTDNVGVAKYQVFRNGKLAGSTAGTVTTYSDTGLSASTLYKYQVRAVDAAGNNSYKSTTASATTLSSGSASAPAPTEPAPTSPTTSGTIPLSFNDPMFNGLANSANTVTIQNGGSLSSKSIVETSGLPSITCFGACTVDRVRVNSREAFRVGGDGTVNISNSYLEANGVGDDHADGLQTYSPGSRGTINVSNSTLALGGSAMNAAFFVADNWTGNINLNNVVIKGGLYGFRVHPDTGGDNVISMKNVYFVGPFVYGQMLLSDVAGNKNIVTNWENVRSATIVNGALVPGSLIPCPISSCGTTSTPTEPAPSTPTAPTTPTGTTYSLWDTSATPAVVNANDSYAIELGTKFSTNTTGQVVGVRFYKGSGNTGTHTGSLWSASGTRLATGTFTSESASGWQTLMFSSPVSIAANTTYVVSYHTNVGSYSASGFYFGTERTSGPITAPRDAGVYKYGSGGFPTDSYQSNNYWVDALFVPTSSTQTPTAATYSLWNTSATPAVASEADSSAVELGTKFSTNAAGKVTGVRFYKGSGNTGTHTGSLWSASGTRLATGTFTSESASGWQTLKFSSPVSIAANTTYVVSYHTNVGRYSANQNYFGTERTSGPITAPRDAGVYKYGSGGFPADSYESTNYWVDVLFTPNI